MEKKIKRQKKNQKNKKKKEIIQHFTINIHNEKISSFSFFLNIAHEKQARIVKYILGKETAAIKQCLKSIRISSAPVS